MMPQVMSLEAVSVEAEDQKKRPKMEKGNLSLFGKDFVLSVFCRHAKLHL